MICPEQGSRWTCEPESRIGVEASVEGTEFRGRWITSGWGDLRELEEETRLDGAAVDHSIKILATP